MPTITDHSGDHTYFTMIPNFIFSLGLSPFALSLYCHFKKVAGETGECYKSTVTLSQETGMGHSSVTSAKQELQEQGLIEIEEVVGEHGGKPSHHITIVNVWERNAQYLAGLRASIPVAEIANPQQGIANPQQGIANPQQGIANPPGGIIKNPLKNSNNNKTEAEPKTPKQQAWEELRNMLVTVSPMDLERFEACWKDHPDFRRHQYALEQTKKFANPVSCKYYETIFLRFDPDKVNEKPKPNGRGDNLRPAKEPKHYAETWVELSRDSGETRETCFERLKKEGRVEPDAVMWNP